MLVWRQQITYRLASNVQNSSLTDMLPQKIEDAAAIGFGDPAKAADMVFELEIEPLQAAFEELNDWLGCRRLRSLTA